MNIKILLLVISATAFASCNTAYKSGQTPDDVYFSPTRVIEENTKSEERDEAKTERIDEREIRMKTRDRRWRDLDYDYDCHCSCDYHPYKYGYNYGYYYNPYYYPYPVYTPGIPYINPKNTTARKANLGGYNTVKTTAIVNPKTGRTEYVTKERTYNNRNNTPREVFSPSNNSGRTYSPSGSSSGSSNSGSGRSVTRPARGN